MTITGYSSGWWAGFRAGYRVAGRSLWRRFLVFWLVAAVLWGSAIALGWEFADRLAKMETGNTVGVIVMNKVQSWLRVFPHK